jgi:hypothetical protein
MYNNESNHNSTKVKVLDEPKFTPMDETIWLGIVNTCPSIIPHLLGVFNMASQAKYGERCGISMSLAVTSQAQGMGISKKLAQAF